MEQRKRFDVIDAKLDAIQQQDHSDTHLPASSMPERVAAEDSTRGIGSLLLNRLNWGVHLQGQSVDVSGWERQLVSAILQSTDKQLEKTTSTLDLSNARLQLVRRRFLQRLEYPQMDDRHVRIEKAYENTFQWIWESNPITEQPWSNFPNWLESDSSLYWVTGKVNAPPIVLSRPIRVHLQI